MKRSHAESFRPHRDAPVIVSHAQNAEDVRLWRIFGSKPPGFYVDVGAGDPAVESVTKLFYDAGWHGLNIEPGPKYELLITSRPRDVNLQLAIAAEPGERELWISSPDPGLSSFARPPKELLPEGYDVTPATVAVARLDDVLAEHAPGQVIDFLKVDVEGAEREVLESLDLKSIRPTVILVESISPLDHRPTHEDWESMLIESEYVLAAFDGINRFYVAGESEHLVPALEYPMSVLDRYMTAHAKQLADAVRRLEGELAEQVGVGPQALAIERERDRLTKEIGELRRELESIYGSRTWRAGRLVATIGSPVTAVGRRLEHKRRTKRLTPAAAYAAVTSDGEAWHFPAPGKRAKRSPGALDPLWRALGGPEDGLNGERASRLADEISRLEWAHETSLLERRLSWEERQAVVETDSIVQLVRGGTIAPRAAIGGARVVLVDARCLQHPAYRSRGVGLHGEGVLRATRRLCGVDISLVLLIDPEQPRLDPAVAELADRQIVTPYELRDADVVLFLELSPMTASAAAAVPFLASSGCSTASVVYDFIPTEYESRYLRSAVATITNRARLEALRRYEFLLPISKATAASCRRLLGNDARTFTTGVADPLHDVPSTRVSATPFVLVPVGGDSRKNAAAAVAAIAEHVRRGGARLRIVVTGSLTEPQAIGIRQLADRTGLSEEALEIRGDVHRSELASLYESAQLVVVPSIAEGFSIPVAESVLRRTPVVASDIDVHRELLGEGPWLSKATDVQALAIAIAHALENRDSVAERQRSALGDSADPDAVARRIEAALAEALESPEPRRLTNRSRRGRARVAFITPFPPQKSGVADFTAATVGELTKHVDVEVYSSATGNSKQPPIRPITAAPFLDPQVDAVVNVIGNSHFHFPMLDLLASYGGACIAHDDRMVEAYGYDRGDPWIAGLLSKHRRVHADELPDLLDNLDDLPSTAYDLIAQQATPLIVHGRSLANRIAAETGVEPVVLPFVPHNLPSVETIDEEIRKSARVRLGLTDDVLHVATFGIVDRRTKGTDLVVASTSWLRDWGMPVRLHVVGAAPPGELRSLQELASGLGVGSEVTFHGGLSRTDFEQFLLAVDAAVQIRTSAVLSLSGGLADCLAYGVPTVTTHDLADELDAPPYVGRVGSMTSSLLIAEAIQTLRDRRHDPAIEVERRQYLRRRSLDAYARGLLQSLAIGVPG